MYYINIYLTFMYSIALTFIPIWKMIYSIALTLIHIGKVIYSIACTHSHTYREIDIQITLTLIHIGKVIYGIALTLIPIGKVKPTKENISELLSGNKLILKPPLKIDEVIEHLTSNKNNIEVVNLSSADFDQMLLSSKGTKDSSRVQ